MNKPDMTLLSSALEPLAETLAKDGQNDSAWSSAAAALAHYGVTLEDDIDLVDAVESRKAEALASILAEWNSGQRLMLVRDRDVLKRALKAYRKSLKVTLLDAESSVSGGPMSAGRHSSIVGIVPPDRYPREVWDKLVQQKKLIDRGHGTYELAPGV